jgi:hypothetical protein
MPNVSVNSVHQDVLLSNVSVAFQQDARNFIASRAFPIIPVDKQSDKYVVIPRGDFNRDEMMPRADGTQSAGSTFSLSNDSYFAEVYALHFDLGPQTAANADDAFKLKQNITEFLTRKALIKKEKLFASQFLITGVWTKDWTGVASGENNTSTRRHWSDPASDPIGDIRAARTSQQLLTGFRPNVLVVGRQVMDALELHPDIIDRVKYGTQTDVSIATYSHLLQLFEVEEILVMDGIENTANKGVTDVHALINGKDALLMYRPSSAGIMTPSAGYTFAWQGAAGWGTTISVEEIPLTKGAQRYEIQMAFDMKKVAADMGTFFDGIVA